MPAAKRSAALAKIQNWCVRSEETFCTVVCIMLLLLLSGSYTQQASAQSAARQEASQVAIDPGGVPNTRFRLAPFLTFGGRIDLEYTFAKDLDLDRTHDDNFSLVEPEVELAFSFDPSTQVQAFLNMELARNVELRDPRKRDRQAQLKLKDAFLRFKNLAGSRFSVQVGRQRFKDDREWLYDQRLDAVRAFYESERLEVELSVSRHRLVTEDLLEDDEHQERINNYLLYVRYKPRKKWRMVAYSLFRDDRSKEQESPFFLGIHSHGEVIENLDYWLELAHVRGQNGSQKLRGWGLDSGLTYTIAGPWQPFITLGYAFGSGDSDRRDGVDRRFRQTGFQENEDKLNGVTRFKYYGEVVDPELSNLLIFTSGIGFRPSKRSSLDLVYHYYLQQQADNSLRGARITEAPSGRSIHLGSEIDLIAGYREIERVDLALTVGYFIPGPAFPTANNSFLVKLEMRLHF
jgi:alginate production protein